MKMWLLSKCD